MISADEWLCANSDGEAATLAPVDGLVELSGDGPARYFTGLTGGAVAVDTGFGVHIIEEAGRRHELPDASLVDALGVAVHEAAWPIVRLLPEATALTSENAHAATCHAARRGSSPTRHRLLPWRAGLPAAAGREIACSRQILSPPCEHLGN